MDSEIEDILAENFLGYEQGENIIVWASQQLNIESDMDVEFLSELAFLDKSNAWEKSKAEKMFLEKFQCRENETEQVVKRYFARLLKKVLDSEIRLWKICEDVPLIKKKFPNAQWTGDLFGYCSNIFHDASNASKPIGDEIKRVLMQLEKNS